MREGHPASHQATSNRTDGFLIAEAPLAGNEEASVLAACAAVLHRRAFLVDPARLARRVIEHLRAPDDRPPFPWEELLPSIDRSLQELLAADRDAEHRGSPPADHAPLVEPFGIPPQHARAAVVAFNACDERVRQAFFTCVVHGDPDAAGLGRGEATAREDLAPLVRRALEALFSRARGERGG